MEPRLDAEVETLNTTIEAEETARIAGDAALQNQINDVKQTSRVYVKNGSSSLAKGTPVYITGADGTNIIIGAASNGSEATSSKVIGLTETDLTANAMGYVVTDGRLVNIDTSAAGAAGDAVWLGVNGGKLYGLSNKPVAPAHMVYLGVVSRKNANTGEIEVKIQNGFELDELHNVSIDNNNLSTGQALTYDGSTQLWKNSTPISSLAGLSDVSLGTLSANEVLKYNGTKWVNGTAAGGVTASDTAPDINAAKQGDAWFDTNDGTLYVCYVDTDSTKQWVQVQANSALEGSILSRLGALESQAIAQGLLSPNFVLNSAFDIWQRGTSVPHAGGGVGADCWREYTDSGSGTQSRDTTDYPVGITGQSYKFTAGANSTNWSIFQILETAHTLPLAGRTVTFSVYVKSNTLRTLKLNWSWATGTDTGWAGAWQTASATNISATSSWARYSVTFTVPSNARTLQFGVGSDGAVLPNGATVNIAGAQLEIGSVATGFRRNQENVQSELTACQRYYYRIASDSIYQAFGAGTWEPSSGGLLVFITHPVIMRAVPTSVSGSNLGVYNGSTFIVVNAVNIGSFGSRQRSRVILTLASAGTAGQYYEMLGNGTAAAFLDFSAEL
jgi:hypothetical protein